MSSAIPSDLSVDDCRNWNFDAVPESQLAACCWWEYARESTCIRDYVEQALDEWPVLGDAGYIIYPESWKALRNIASEDDSLNVFLQSLPLQPNAVHVLPDRTVLCWPNKPRPIEWLSLTLAERRKWAGSFPAPWLSLTGTERQEWVKLLNALNTRKFVPVNLADSSQAKLLLRHWQSVVSGRNEKQQEWYRRYFRRDESGKPYVLPGALDNQPDYEAIRPGISLGNVELLTLEIAWGQYTNGDIADYFRKVVSDLRPKDKPPPDGRGHDSDDVRSDLRRLAVLRLRSRYEMAEILGTKTAMAIPQCREILEKKQFAAERWLEHSRWTQAEREAIAKFRELFPRLPACEMPFLPAVELPLSYHPKPSRKTSR